MGGNSHKPTMLGVNVTMREGSGDSSATNDLRVLDIVQCCRYGVQQVKSLSMRITSRVSQG